MRTGLHSQRRDGTEHSSHLRTRAAGFRVNAQLPSGGQEDGTNAQSTSFEALQQRARTSVADKKQVSLSHRLPRPHPTTRMFFGRVAARCSCGTHGACQRPGNQVGVQPGGWPSEIASEHTTRADNNRTQKNSTPAAAQQHARSARCTPLRGRLIPPAFHSRTTGCRCRSATPASRPRARRPEAARTARPPWWCPCVHTAG